MMVLFLQRDGAIKVFEHLVSLGMKPNLKTYDLLVDAHLIKRDIKAALSTINDMVIICQYSLSLCSKQISDFVMLSSTVRRWLLDLNQQRRF